MFGLFKKKFKKISEYPDTHSVAKGIMDNKPMFIMYRSGLQDAIGHPEYPFQIRVAVPLLNPTTDGLPAGTEFKDLVKIEDSLVEKLDDDDKSVFAMSINFNGMREFVFYASEWTPELFEQKVKSVSSGSHKLQFMMKKDPKWDTFKQLSSKSSEKFSSQ